MEPHEELEAVRRALQDSASNVVLWATDEHEARAARDLAPRNFRSASVIPSVRQLTRETGGACVEQRQEKRDSSDHKFPRDYWYRVIVPLPEFRPHGPFVEIIVADPCDPDVPEVLVVSAHPQ